MNESKIQIKKEKKNINLSLFGICCHSHSLVGSQDIVMDEVNIFYFTIEK